MARIPALAVMAGASLLAATAAPARAETQSFSVSSAGPLDNSLSFDLFDTSLGTLTGVSFALGSSSSSQHATISVTGGEGGTGSGSTSVHFLASGPGLAGPDAITLFSGTGTASASCSGFNCTHTDSTVSNPTFSTPVSVTAATDLPSYEGIGTFDVDVDLNGYTTGNTACNPFSINNPATCTTTGSAAWSGDITVTFQFTPAVTDVPEPGTFGLFAAALSGLAMLTRRRGTARR